MKFVSPYLNFNGNAEEAFDFYRSVFGGEYRVMRFRNFPGGAPDVSESDLDKIAHISLPLVGDVSLMASDVIGEQVSTFNAGNNVYLYLETESAEDAERLFAGLSEGGTVEMPLQSTGWSEKYGSLIDRFGVLWMLSYTGDVQFSM